jgi:hypothetical protein
MFRSVFFKLSLSAAFFCGSGFLQACCLTFAEGADVRLSQEKVIIVWNAKSKMQHFVRQARFDTNEEDFGFIVPTPTIPDLGVADERAFEQLEMIFARLAQTRAAAATDSVGAGFGGVEVVKREIVGDYEATVVRASDGAALSSWLAEHGFASRPAMTEWLDHYSKQDWVFTAFRFLRDEPTGALTQAIRLSFQTDKPHYPYKMPRDTWPAGWKRPMTVYFVAAGPGVSRYVGSDANWEAQVRDSVPLTEDDAARLAKNLGLRTQDLPGRPSLTVFENGANPDGYDRDIYFATMGGVGPWPWVGGAAAIFVIGLWALTMRGRRSSMPQAA